MKTIDEFLTSLSQQDVKLWLEDDRLCCDAPEEVLTSNLSSQLAERKQEIIAFLNRVNLVSRSNQTITPVARTENIPSKVQTFRGARYCIWELKTIYY